LAAGFTPKFIQDVPLDGLTQEQFLVLANETAKEMKWVVSYLSDIGLIAYTNKGMFKWNAKVEIKIENGIANITSSSTGSEMVDWGKNKKNIAAFVSAFDSLKPTFTNEELAAKYSELKENITPADQDILKLPPPTTAQQITVFFSIFKPTKGLFYYAHAD
jgi:rhomboid protease GluP